MRAPDADGEAALKFVLFEKIGDVWHADKSDEVAIDGMVRDMECQVVAKKRFLGERG